MGLLTFEEIKKKIPTKEEWKKIMFDDGPYGGYLSNMSEEDEKKFRAKHIKGEDERIEIRVLLGGSNVVVVVYKKKRKSETWPEKHNDHENMKFSTNGSLNLTFEDWENLYKAIEEAKQILNA